MLMNPFQRRDDPHGLVVGMTSVKMGDRFVQVGCANGGRLGAIAARVGLSGHAAAIVPDQDSAERAQKGAAQAGALVDIVTAPPSRLEADDEAFDVAVVDETDGLLGRRAPEYRMMAMRELLRILRPGGRVVVIATLPRGGIGAVFSRAQSGPPWKIVDTLQAEGFTAVRTLAERDGLRFVEGIKPRKNA